jgi:hypothetical protein
LVTQPSNILYPTPLIKAKITNKVAMPVNFTINPDTEDLVKFAVIEQELQLTGPGKISS